MMKSKVSRAMRTFLVVQRLRIHLETGRHRFDKTQQPCPIRAELDRQETRQPRADEPPPPTPMTVAALLAAPCLRGLRKWHFHFCQ